MVVTEEAAGHLICPNVEEQNCVARGCMAWRETGSEHKGYCGLAGMPVSVGLDMAVQAARRAYGEVKK